MEGPSLHLLAQELQPFVGHVIQRIGGNAAFDKEPLKTQHIKEIYAFGKRLIIQLDTVAIAVHFLMYGSYRIDQERMGMIPRLAIDSGTHIVYFYNGSVKCIPQKDLKRKLDFETDILSDTWNSAKAFKKIRKNPEQTIDDVLLDQDIFAGVGNIIKNEVLFLSRVRPTTQIGRLPAKKLKEIITITRSFSEQFLAWKREFVLRKNLRIYQKRICPVCQGNVTRMKTGRRNRWSYFCAHCQK